MFQTKMGVLRVVSRLLILLYFFVSGIVKLAEPSLFRGNLIFKYSWFLSAFHQRFGVAFPFSEGWLAQNSVPIIYAVGALTLLGAILALFEVRLGAILLCCNLALISIFVNNPLTAPNDAMRSEETSTLLVHVSVLGGLLGTMDDPDPVKDEN